MPHRRRWSAAKTLIASPFIGNIAPLNGSTIFFFFLIDEPTLRDRVKFYLDPQEFS